MSSGNGGGSLLSAWKANLDQVESHFGNLVKAHLELASTELKEAAGSAGRHVGLLVVGALALGLSVVFLTTGLALVLGERHVLSLSSGAWFLIFGGLYLLAGLLLCITMGGGLKRDVRLLDQTREELREGMVWVRDEILHNRAQRQSER